ncbi:DUF3772 domain-containing protein [Altererythrobacter salegens]|uniref:DUF3772 domain-containing protein n=1 Tax=Croceibacterium salegens TaxID=1737568 RepID=A0A6I4SVM6_9SPHN|nr:DUF3772 domain-containing protein [Croceibacterium salegens]MXO59097.1 DUF3772 domain-containing protein [Croceibacterium salegens]
MLRHLLAALLAVATGLLLQAPLAAAAPGPASTAAAPAVESKSDALRIRERIEALEKRRAELAKLRDSTKVMSEKRSLDALVLDASIKDLGPRPAEGETESPLIESERLDLETRLRRLEAPRLAIRRDYLRYQIQVEQLDDEISDLKMDQLFARSPTPLNPAAWVSFAGETGSKLAALRSGEEQTGLGALLATFVPMIVGLGLTYYVQRYWLKFVRRRLELSERRIAVFGYSIARDIVLLAILLAGVGATTALALSLATSPEMANLAASIMLVIGLPTVIAYWLGQSLLSPDVPQIRELQITNSGAQKALVVFILLGVVISLEAGLELVEVTNPYGDRAASVAPFLLILAMAFLLFRLGSVLKASRVQPEISPEGTESSLELPEAHQDVQFVPVLAKAMAFAGIAAVVTGGIGYIALSRQILLPTIETLTVVAFTLITWRRLCQLSDGFIDRLRPETPRNHPVAHFLIAVALLLVAMPFISTFWGVRAAQMLDLLAYLRDGIQIGDMQISFKTVAIFFGVFLAGYVITHWTQRILQYTLFSQIGLDEGTRSALVTGVGYVGLLLSLLVAIAAAGLDLSSLAIVFGALSVGIGFGLQSVVANFVSGIILLIERPIKKGDWITVGSVSGVVEKIAVRATRIKSFERDDVIVPNSELIAGIVHNKTFADTNGRVELVIGIAYESDVRKAMELAKAVTEAHENVMSEPPVSVTVTELGASSLALRVFAYIDDVREMGRVRSELYLTLLEKFGAAGIEIPFPQNEIRFRDPHIAERLAPGS